MGGNIELDIFPVYGFSEAGLHLALLKQLDEERHVGEACSAGNLHGLSLAHRYLPQGYPKGCRQGRLCVFASVENDVAGEAVGCPISVSGSYYHTVQARSPLSGFQSHALSFCYPTRDDAPSVGQRVVAALGEDARLFYRVGRWLQGENLVAAIGNRRSVGGGRYGGREGEGFFLVVPFRQVQLQ